jgi:nitrogen fixation/metabolism regulation signal transduction histidine kinase
MPENDSISSYNHAYDEYQEKELKKNNFTKILATAGTMIVLLMVLFALLFAVA